MLVDNGASVSPTVTSKTTHIIVASPSSPHSQDNWDKLTQVQQPAYANIKTVWEGWATEVVEQGGVRTDREKVWEWTFGKGEPTPAELAEEDVRIQARSVRRQNQGLHDASESDTTGRQNEHQDEAAELTVVAKAKKTSASRKEVGAVDTLIGNFLDGGRDTSERPVASSSAVPRANSKDHAQARAADFDAQLAAGAPFGKGKGHPKSLIQALANKSRFDAEAATEADDSAFFDNPDEALGEQMEVEGDGWNEPQIFQGTRIALMGLGARCATVRGAIVSRGGVAWIDEREDEADWIVVPVFGCACLPLSADAFS